MTAVFLHGLESSSKGAKARWFTANFPDMVISDFEGLLDNRMEKLNTILAGFEDLVLIGSSFGGLMATIYAQEKESQVRKVVLLAPALNFPDFSAYTGKKVDVPAWLYIGSKDTVCPPDIVIPAAQNIFPDLSVHVSDDDHFLHNTFSTINWGKLLKS